MQKSDTHFLAIIIPMYNEERNAETCVLKIMETLSIHHLNDVHLFVVNDGSTDCTNVILSSLFEKNGNFTLVTYEGNKGYGGAVESGYKTAGEKGFQYALVMDSDLTNDPELIPIFWHHLRSNQYDLIKASRYIKGGGMKGVPLYRQLVTILGNKIASLLFGMGLKDCTNGFRAVRLNKILNYSFKERGFPSILEELYVLKMMGVATTEIPYTLTARRDGEHNSKFTYRFSIFRNYLKYALFAFFGRGLN